MATLSIGGLCFRVETAGGLALDHPRPPLDAFLVDDPASPSEEVRVVLDPSRPPAECGPVIFRSAARWTLHAGAAGARSFVMRPAGAERALYTADFHPDRREVRVACSPDLLRAAGTRLANPFHYPLDQILTMYLLRDRGFVLHAAGVVVSGAGVALAGVSGAGKTTFARLAEARSGWAVGLSDDRVVIRLGPTAGVFVHGSPWCGEGRVASPARALLRALLFLEQGDSNAIRLLSTREALARLCRTASVPWFDRDRLGAALTACGALVQQVPCCALRFRPEAAALDVVERFLSSFRS